MSKRNAVILSTPSNAHHHDFPQLSYYSGNFPARNFTVGPVELLVIINLPWDSGTTYRLRGFTSTPCSTGYDFWLVSRVWGRSRYRCHERFYLSEELHVGLTEYLLLGWAELARHGLRSCGKYISML